MDRRKNIIIVYGVVYSFLAAALFFGLRYYSQKKFTADKLNEMIIGKSKFRPDVTNLCGHQALGEPKVGKEYVKVNFFCTDGTKANSTFALAAFDNKTVGGVLKEYARIIGFNENIISEKGWYCLVNNGVLDENVKNELIKPASSIDCFENKSLAAHD